MKRRRMSLFLRALVLSVPLALLPVPAGAKNSEGSEIRRGLFVTVVQDPQTISTCDGIDSLIDFSRRSGIGELFIQVYYANRSWFPSETADRTPYETCVKNVSEDAFGLLIKKAHAAGIRVHAWLNLLSLGNNKDALILKKYGPGILTRNRKEKRSIEDYRIDGQYFLEPGDGRVREALLRIVEEVVSAYPDLDGVQFDYIRYPDTSPAYGYTPVNMERYKDETGSDSIGECDKSWKEWKRRQVTELLDALTKKARTVRPGIEVSATGCMPYVRAYYEAFQDWPSWLENGIVDFVTVMSYSPYPGQFERWIAKAGAKVRDFSKVNIGLGAYRLAGSPGIFRNEFRIAGSSGAGGWVIFHYGSLREEPALADVLTGGRGE